jgi:hypothetical protein
MNKKIILETYENSSTDEGLKALLFKLKIPNNLPLKVEPIEALSKKDIDHIGMKLDIQYSLPILTSQHYL